MTLLLDMLCSPASLCGFDLYTSSLSERTPERFRIIGGSIYTHIIFLSLSRFRLSYETVSCFYQRSSFRHRRKQDSVLWNFLSVVLFIILFLFDFLVIVAIFWDFLWRFSVTSNFFTKWSYFLIQSLLRIVYKVLFYSSVFQNIKAIFKNRYIYNQTYGGEICI